SSSWKRGRKGEENVGESLGGKSATVHSVLKRMRMVGAAGGLRRWWVGLVVKAVLGGDSGGQAW
nr:hypothetical protein [Tanacetum cinerariifolium]